MGWVFTSQVNEDLARVVSDTMFEQGCQELVSIDDMILIAMFWKNYLEENKLVTFKKREDLH